MTLEQTEIIQRLQHLDEYAFEQFVAELWERRGWETEVTGKSNDKGIDVIATRSVPYSEKEIIQAKRYRRGNRVGRPELQKYASLNQHDRDTDKVIVVCTSGFTDGALGYAKETNVKCVDGTTLAKIISELNAVDLVEQYTESVGSKRKEPNSQRTKNTNQTGQEATKENEQLTLVESGQEVTAELVGIEQVSGEISSGSFMSVGGGELDGVIVALKLFNQTDVKLGIDYLDAFTFKDQYDNTYSPFNLGKGEFENGWRKHGGGFTFNTCWIEPGSRVKYTVAVSLPSHSQVTEITLEQDEIHFRLDSEARRKLPDLPEGIQSTLSD